MREERAIRQMQISYNKLKTFNDCALKYRLAYIERVPRPPIAALAFQRRLHTALANYHFLAKRDGTVCEEELLGYYADSWDVMRHPEVRETKSYQEGEGILRRYCEVENEKARVPVYLELPIKVAFGPYTLTGKVDRIDFAENNRYSIIDYKLDRRLPDTNAAEKSDQLSFYTLLVSDGLGMAIQDVRLYYLRHGVEQISVPSKTRVRETIDWIDTTANGIHKEKNWAPCLGAGCATCAFHSLCPAKTGRPRDNQKVWQQGNLMWEMSEEPEPIASDPDAKVAEAIVRQMTLDDYL